MGALRSMAVAALVVGGALTAVTPSTASAQDAGSLSALVWMAGCWEGDLGNGASYEESWMAPRGGMMLGTARMIRGGRVVSFEFLRIVDAAGTPVYLPQPGGQAATPFRSIGVEGSSVVFENLEHDFPQRIFYTLTPPDQLVARIEGPGDGGEIQGMEFPMARVACPG